MPSERKLQTKELKKIFKLYPQIKLVYLFGSRVNGKVGPLSDYDFAVYLEEKDKAKMFEIRLKLMAQLGLLLKTNAVDLVVLNTADSPNLKYEIIKEGKVIFEKEPYKVLVEPKILHEYFDFNLGLVKYGLTAKI